MRRASAKALFDTWQAARKRGLNNRAAALDAGISEAELLASGCGRGVTRLAGDFLALLRSLSELGEIKSVVRNACAVQERTGSIILVESMAESNGTSTLIQGDTFLLHAEVGAWTRGFALTEPGKYGLKRSIQFFTDAGVSAAKCFLTSKSDESVYRSLVQRFSSADQRDAESGIAAAGVSAQPVQARLLSGFLGNCLIAANRLSMPVEVSVANACATQITVKTLERIKRSDRGGWINVLDTGLDLHLHEERIGHVHVWSAGESATLHWYADDGVEVLTMRVTNGGAELVAAATTRSERR